MVSLPDTSSEGRNAAITFNWNHCLSRIKELRENRPIIISSAAVVVLIAGGVSYSLLSQSAPPELPATKPSPAEPPPQVAQPAEHPPPEPPVPPPSFEQKMESLQKAIAEVCTTGDSQEITLSFSETEVNNQAAKSLAKAEIPEDIPLDVESIYIDLKPDNRVQTEARSVIFDRFRVTIKAKAEVTIKEGKPAIEVTNISFGFVPVPGALKDRIVALGLEKIETVQAKLASAACDGGVDLQFTRIEIDEDRITIKGTIKPKG